MVREKLLKLVNRLNGGGANKGRWGRADGRNTFEGCNLLTITRGITLLNAKLN